MKNWEQIRAIRPDLTDYVIHLTRGTWNNGKPKSGLTVLLDILRTGYIVPSLAPRRNRHGSEKPTIQGPHPVVCFTDQPLSALLTTLSVAHGRYDGYGIAFFKPFLHNDGARPVLYGTEEDLRLLPEDLQYLWARYEPLEPGSNRYPFDFTWEREWRRKFPSPGKGNWPKGLEIMSWRDCVNSKTPARTSIIVRHDKDVFFVRGCLKQMAATGQKWASRLQRIISLDTVERELEKGDKRYGKIETWPDD